MANRPRLTRRGRHLLATLASRRRDWSLANTLWQELSSAGDLRAIESLAKHKEHRERDFTEALGLTRRLLMLENASRHRHRERRLPRKLRRMHLERGCTA